MTDTSKDAVDRLVLAMIRSGNTTAANMLTALAVERDAANARADAARDAALRDAAGLVQSTAYTSNGDGRSLEPVSAGLVGMDMHHATIAAAILALRDKPAHGVTVQKAAKDESAATCVGCGQPATGMCWTDCGMSLCGAPICDTCRHIDETHGWTHGPRAIAGGGDE